MAGVNDLEKARTFAMGHGRTSELIVARKKETDEDSEGTGQEFGFGEVPIIHPIPNELNQVVVDRLERRINQYQNGKKDIVEYSLTNLNRDDAPIQQLEGDDFPMLDSIDELLTVNNFPDTSYEKPRPDFQVIRIRDSGGRTLLAFRLYTNYQLIREDKKSLMFLRDQEYTKVEQDEMVALPNKLDALYFDGVFTVFKQKNFEDIFDWVDELEEQTDDVLATIETSEVLVHDMEELRTRVGSDRRKMRKMYEVTQNGIVDDLDMSTAEDIIDEFGLDLDIVENGDGEEGIAIPNGNKVWDVIRLFNNDHLVSPVDASRFQVYGKDKRN